MGKESELDRRKFLEVGIFAITGSIAAVSTVALARFTVGPSFNKERSKWIEVELEDLRDENAGFTRAVLEYEKKDGWLITNKRTLAYVKRINEEEVIAINAGCTHLGCIVTWDEDSRTFKCPCHNGMYDEEGRVISGPPPAPLKRHKTKIEDGKIFLTTATVPYGGDESESV
jgi:Rieske Fe-S protein